MEKYLQYTQLLMFLFSLFFSLHSVQSQDSPELFNSTRSRKQVDNEYLVLLKNDGTDVNTQVSQIGDFLHQSSGEDERLLKILSFGTMHILHIYASDDTAQGLSSRPEVDIIEPNIELSLEHLAKGIEENGVEGIEENGVGNIQTTPDGNICVHQKTKKLWGLTRISSKVKPGNYKKGKYFYNKNGGEGVEVYVLDSGIFIDHVEFEGRARRGYTARDVKKSEGEEDLYGHGTHCAGTIGSRRYGVAKKVKLVAVKVINKTNHVQMDDHIDGLEWILKDFKNRKCKAVVNMSMRFPGKIAEKTVNKLIEAGLPVVVAAGNDKMDACLETPARMKNVITVSATDKSDQMVKSSNYGSCVDILAPGKEILSTSTRSSDASRFDTGTSMACPHVSGAIAIMLSNMDTMPTPEEIKLQLLNNATEGQIALGDKPNTPNLLLYTGCNKGAQGRDSSTGTTVFVSITFVLVFMH